MSRNFGLARRVETERETDGRWIGEVPDLPGVLVYASTRSAAIRKARSLARQVRRRIYWWRWVALALLAGIALSAALAGCAAPVSAVPNYEPGLTVFCQAHPHRGTCP